MSFPGRSRDPGNGNGGVVMSAGRGAVLVGVAVIVGLLLLAIVSDGGPGVGDTAPVADTTPNPTTVPTTPATNLDGTPFVPPTEGNGTTATTKKKSTSTTDPSKGARPNDQVVVQVLNGSGIANAATTRTNDLKGQGYQTVPAGNAPAERNGTGVQCKDGYGKEAAALVAALQGLGVTAAVESLAAPPPTSFDVSANCYVILGR